MLRSIAMALAAFIMAGLCWNPAQAASPTADTIIARHIEARGGAAAIHAIRSLDYEDGTYSEGSYTGHGDAVMMMMRPYYKLVGRPDRHPDFMEGYDGAAWEWYADPGITLRTVGAASAASRHNTDVEGPFLDYADKGSSVELVGEARIGDRPAYQVRLVMMDGYATDYFIDQQSYLIIASRHTAEVHAFGPPVTSETRYGDFRRVAGVLFPFRGVEVVIATGRELNSMQWGRIEANVDIPPAWFSPPRYEHTPVQTFMEQLFVQRDDPAAMMWTYRLFRRAHPDIETREAAQIIGYQTLKMGQVQSAIALLERNAADYPDSADSAFGLGRAYATAKRTDDARRAFERALRLEPGHKRATDALAGLPH